MGSSPHTRGLRRPRRARPLAGRIIPACAGFTVTLLAISPAPPDHPRVRGVYLAKMSVLPGCFGSSPHARGLRLARRARGDLTRIIPACAGFTPPATTPTGSGGDHPRTRGVYAAATAASAATTGSSPHARGLPAPPRRGGPGGRIIPACAGFTGRSSGSPPR